MRREAQWSFVLVEDNEQVKREVMEYMEGEEFAFGSVAVQPLSDFEEALPLLRQRKVDLLILDVMGHQDEDKTAGIRILEEWRATGFSPVIFYTALPESVQELESPLVRVVGKDSGGLSRLGQTIREIFALRIPQTHRALAQHFDSALREYMWGFVLENWSRLRGLIDRPDFVRLLLHRLAAQFSREGVESIVEKLYPGTSMRTPEGHMAHPTEYYIKPPIGTNPQLGDIRRLEKDLFVVVWPSCDLVLRGESCKVERALCARALPLADYPEFKEWLSERGSSGKRKALEALMKNNRQSARGQSERVHFLPSAWDIPASIVDFQDLRHVEMAELRGAECLATVASPFAESIGTRFIRYLGRLGTPDLDIEACIDAL